MIPHNKPMTDWGKVPTRRKYGGQRGHPRRFRVRGRPYSTRWTLRRNPSSNPEETLQKIQKRLRISGIGAQNSRNPIMHQINDGSVVSC